MTAPLTALPLSADHIPARKKRVLLLDTSQAKRDLRADVMRKLGIEVDCAADVVEARCWWRADLYNLVLINASTETDSRDKFCTDLRSATPPQRIAFFVGGPEYLAAAPHTDEDSSEPDADALHRELVAELLAQTSAGPTQRWGILEACKKISSVRAVSEARTRAIREIPRPPRWTEAAFELHSTPEATTPKPFAIETAAPLVTATETEREEIL